METAILISGGIALFQFLIGKVQLTYRNKTKTYSKKFQFLIGKVQRGTVTYPELQSYVQSVSIPYR